MEETLSTCNAAVYIDIFGRGIRLNASAQVLISCLLLKQLLHPKT